jgi:hypothetical protein
VVQEIGESAVQQDGRDHGEDSCDGTGAPRCDHRRHDHACGVQNRHRHRASRRSVQRSEVEAQEDDRERPGEVADRPSEDDRGRDLQRITEDRETSSPVPRHPISHERTERQQADDLRRHRLAREQQSDGVGHGHPEGQPEVDSTHPPERVVGKDEALRKTHGPNRGERECPETIV